MKVCRACSAWTRVTGQPKLFSVPGWLANVVLTSAITSCVVASGAKRVGGGTFRGPALPKDSRLSASKFHCPPTGSFPSIRMPCRLCSTRQSPGAVRISGAGCSCAIALRAFYRDFAVFKADRCGCPADFGKLTSCWYLNHAGGQQPPNVRCNIDEGYRFYASRRIEAGEELTACYSDYSLPSWL